MDKETQPGSPLSLPKGGGAIGGIGETFKPDLFTGTGHFAIPIATSPGRDGFGPKLLLQYSTGNGNGLFGLGWQLSIPRISRKTEKGIPKYGDGDIFVMSGAEDLVPDSPPVRTSGDYTIRRYRPRTEGLFARIENWFTLDATGHVDDSFWRVTSKNNETSIYGLTPATRVFDADDPKRISEWLLEESFDPKGNHIAFEYAADDPDLYKPDSPDRLTDLQEQNRMACQRYPRRIYYGYLNRTVTYDDGSPVGASRTGSLPDDPAARVPRQYVFEVVFDYDGQPPKYVPGDQQQELFGKKNPPLRDDPFSSYRAGFEVRTLRLCRRVFMVHHFAELGGARLVRSTDFEYITNPDTRVSFLKSATSTGYRWDGTTYIEASMPKVTFEYSAFKPEQQTFQSLRARDGAMPPRPLSDPNFALVDLSGDGLPDVLHTSAAGFRYWKNVGGGVLESPQLLPQIPGGLQLSNPQVALADMDGNGLTELAVHEGTLNGYFESTPGATWNSFRQYATMPSFDLADANVRLVDVTGDGRSDALMTCEHHFLWFPCLGAQGFAAPECVERQHDLDVFPDIYFDDSSQRVRVADMNGDGLSDIVLLQGGRIDYWPNLGYGRFGKRITMALPDPPQLLQEFEPSRLFLADLDGSGCADLVYVEFDRVHFWFNQSGNTWSERRTIYGTPIVRSGDAVEFADVFGTGTATLVWSYELEPNGSSNYKALDFCGGLKPYLLTETSNSMGASTRVGYAPSTKFALADQQAGRPWFTPLPFPVHVVEKVEVIDFIGKTKLVTRYEYHHGYYDGIEREFRGFGRVDQYDTETFDEFNKPGLHPDRAAFTNDEACFHLPPAVTKNWFHTGIYYEPRIPSLNGTFSDDRELTRLYREREFYAGDPLAFTLDEHEIGGTNPREARRALRGCLLRTEAFALDGIVRAKHPYVISENRFRVRELQQGGTNAYGVYLTTPLETITFHYERNPDDPRISHKITDADDFGNVTHAVTIAYPRRTPQFPEQSELKVTYARSDFINDVDGDEFRYAGIPCQTRTYEVTGVSWNGAARLQKNVFEPIFDTGIQPGAFQPFGWTRPSAMAGIEKRLIAWTRSYFRKDAAAAGLDIDVQGSPVRTLADRLALGSIEALALPYETYEAAFTDPLLQTVYRHSAADPPLIDAAALISAGYCREPDRPSEWWIPSGQESFDPGRFYLPLKKRDAFGNDTGFDYDDFDLLLTSMVDALDNRTTVTTTVDAAGNKRFTGNNYRVLQPETLLDPNGNMTAVAFDTLGMVAGTAVMGKGAEADSLEDFASTLDANQVEEFLLDPAGNAASLLQKATTRTIYALDRFERYGLPVMIASISRETHAAMPGGDQTKIQQRFLYYDGFGREIRSCLQAEPDTAEPLVPRWVASGSTVFNNKGKPVRKYESFFTHTHEFESPRREGVPHTFFYDPLGRVIASLFPNHTYEKSVFDAWRQENWDANDTLHPSHRFDPSNPLVVADHRFNPVDDPHIGSLFGRMDASDYWPTWYCTRMDPAAVLLKWPDFDANGNAIPENGDTRAAEKDAAEKTARHAATPSVAHLDTQARTFLYVVDNGKNNSGADVFFETRLTLDAAGRTLAVIDPRGASSGVQSSVNQYDMSGRKLAAAVKDDGRRLGLQNVAGNVCYSWDGNRTRVRTVYDKLQRPLQTWVLKDNASSEYLAQRTQYGESNPNTHAGNTEYAPNADRNLRTRVYRVFDGAGILTNEAYDFKGNLTESSRQFVLHDHLAEPDWSETVPTEADVFQSGATFDALNRVIDKIEGTAANRFSSRSEYNAASLLERIEVQQPGVSTPATTISNVEYNAKGQKTRIEYSATGFTTEHFYDTATFRLARTVTRAGGTAVQMLRYTYDPVGNVVQVYDGAFRSVFNCDQQVNPSTTYRYDASYRLIEAHGREHRALGACHYRDELKKHTEFVPVTPQPLNNGCDLRNYDEFFTYDDSGNLGEIRHAAGPTATWTRTQTFAADSNRLNTSVAGCADESSFTFEYDGNGNIRALPHLKDMRWDHANRLLGGETNIATNVEWDKVRYSYDAAGERVRKIIERGGQRTEERIYLHGFEIYRRYNGANPSFERQTLHVSDGDRRLGLVEWRAVDTSGTEAGLSAASFRFQLDNQIGSSLLELDALGKTISYEEYYAYGGTAYLAGEDEARSKLKRYRHRGKELDDETGLYYYGARYYAPWLGRWISCDPGGAVDGTNLYRYCRNNPVTFVDHHGLQSETPVKVWPAEKSTHQDSSGRMWISYKPESRHTVNIPSAPPQEDLTFDVLAFLKKVVSVIKEGVQEILKGVNDFVTKMPSITSMMHKLEKEIEGMVAETRLVKELERWHFQTLHRARLDKIRPDLEKGKREATEDFSRAIGMPVDPKHHLKAEERLSVIQGAMATGGDEMMRDPKVLNRVVEGAKREQALQNWQRRLRNEKPITRAEALAGTMQRVVLETQAGVKPKDTQGLTSPEVVQGLMHLQQLGKEGPPPSSYWSAARGARDPKTAEIHWERIIAKYLKT